MKKRFSALFGILFLLGALLIPFAGSRPVLADGLAGQSIIDEADLLNPSAEAEINADIAGLDEKYQTNIVILTVTSMQRPELKNGQTYYDIQAFTQDYYDFVCAGGVEKDGIILCVNMEPSNREFCVVTTGKEINRFQSKMSYIYDKIYDDLSRTEYEAAARTFVILVEVKHRLGFYPPSFLKVVICLAIGLLAGWLVTKGMEGGMDNVHAASSAGSYMIRDSFRVRRQHEIFLHSTISQTARQTEHRSGGGGGISIGSSGISHGGGGGHSF